MSKWVDAKSGPYAPFFNNLEEMWQTHQAKNHDYAGDGGTYFNFEYAAQVAAPFTGVDAVFATMIGIKLARLAILKRTKEAPKNEPIIDTQKDLATYSTIWWTYLCEQEARLEQRRRVRPRVRKRKREIDGSRGSASKRRVAAAKAARRSYGASPRGLTSPSRRKSRRTI
jgi:hypothetical protein